MSNRKKFSSNQLVTQEQLNGAFDDAEDGDRSVALDFGFTGVFLGVVATASSPESMLVNLTAGLAYSKGGGRILVPTDQVVDMSSDELGAFTDPPIGHERWVSVFARQARIESVPLGPDLNADIIYFEQDESFEIAVVNGASAPPGFAGRPDLDEDDVLIFDVLLVHGQTTIAQGDIDTTRAEIMIEFSGVPGFELERVDPHGALEAMYTKLAEIVSGAQTIDGSGVLFTDVAPTWANLATVTGTTAPNNTFNKFMIGIVGDIAGSGGTARMGGSAFTVGAATVAAGSLLAQLTALASAASINVPAGPNWADGTANAQQTLADRFNASTGIIARLATTAASNGGARYVGMDSAVGHFTGKSTVRDWLLALNTNTSATANGAYFVSFFPTSKFTEDNVYENILRLERTTTGSDGASHVGTEATGGLAGATLRAQLDEIDAGWGKLDRANTWTSKQTIDVAGAGFETTLGTSALFGDAVTFDGSATCNDGVNVAGGDFQVVGDAAFAVLGAGAGGDATFNRAVVLNDAATLNGDITLAGEVQGEITYATSIVGRWSAHAPVLDVPTNWAFDGAILRYVNSVIGAKVYQRITPPPASTLLNVYVFYRPADETRSDTAPENMPSARLLRTSTTTDVTVLATAAAVWTTETSYESGAIPIALLAVNELVDQSYMYWIEFSTESGMDSFSGTSYGNAQWEANVVKQTKG